MKSKFLDRLLSIGKFKNFSKNIRNIAYKIFGAKLRTNLQRVQKLLERFIKNETFKFIFTFSKRLSRIIQSFTSIGAFKAQSLVVQRVLSRFLLKNLNLKNRF
ncbi:hypothetical protein LEP1GSC037_5382 [Leptospira interrogans str. 2006001854]|uniref:Uncharacterized protein n=1 Tax=Leptospira interrogans str. 2006001854 TaxID=1001590 RepID=M6GDH7_LEPIR|nr:hypothetical protein LEP1GSC037_5382 [Leptospira interrogans str. 2006001854]